ncbi:MAG: aminoacyl-tRNA hydrolase, partial [Spirochaetia bacterium]|nr:aminoacyl-tRNA hydrolase [Spirochaetia bacterium]
MRQKQTRKNKLRIAVIGLGNPGRDYSSTRHNAGFLTVDVLSQKLGIKLKKSFFANYYYGKGVYMGKEIFLIKPLTFMNRSGLIIRSITVKKKIDLSEILVVCDNMDLLPGVVRLKKGGGDAGHNGLKSIMSYTGTGEFKRFYIGIGRPVDQEEVNDYV